MQFKVPQDVLRPDKIVGFLTLRQLVIVAIGGGISYSLYIILSKQYFVEIWLPPVLFVAAFTVAFAFLKYHDLAFERLILLFIEYKVRPRSRTWQKLKGDVVLSVLASPLQKSSIVVVSPTVMTEQERRKKLEEISKVVDTTNL